MIRFKQYILFENPQSIYDKYFDDIEWVDYVRLVSLDPTSKMKKGEIKKVGKYVKFLKRWWNDLNYAFFDVKVNFSYFGDSAKNFNRLLKNYNDLSSSGKMYKIIPIDTFKSLRDFAGYLMMLDNIDKDHPIVMKTTKNYDFVRQITTHVGAKFFTPRDECNWCTGWESEGYWNQYMGDQGDQGKIFVMYKKKRPYIQLYFSKNMSHLEIQKRSSPQGEISLSKFMMDNEDIKKYLVKNHKFEPPQTIDFHGRSFKFVYKDDYIIFNNGLDLSDLDLTSFTEFQTVLPKGITKYAVEGDFHGSDNQIADLIGSPFKVSGYFDISDNAGLEQIIGAPKEIGGDFLIPYGLDLLTKKEVLKDTKVGKQIMRMLPDIERGYLEEELNELCKNLNHYLGECTQDEYNEDEEAHSRYNAKISEYESDLYDLDMARGKYSDDEYQKLNYEYQNLEKEMTDFEHDGVWNYYESLPNYDKYVYSFDMDYMKNDILNEDSKLWVWWREHIDMKTKKMVTDEIIAERILDVFWSFTEDHFEERTFDPSKILSNIEDVLECEFTECEMR